MYYLIDANGYEVEGKTLAEVCTRAEQEVDWYTSLEEAIKQGSVTIIKGTKIKVKVIPPTYEEVKPVATKAAIKKVTKKGTK